MNHNIIRIGGHSLDLARAQVMLIANLTPDSFFRASRVEDERELIRRVVEGLQAGASIVDLGGYSTRPGAQEVSEGEELRRLTQGARIVRREFPQAILSLDTFRSQVARAVMEEVGCCIINDAGGICGENMAAVAAEFGAPYIVMHTRGTPADMAALTDYADLESEVRGWLLDQAARLKNLGVEQIILDPGFGFAKTPQQSLKLLASLSKLCGEGYPVLAGISRKSMIYKTLGITPEEALAGTVALNWEALRQGARILRVHDAREACQVVNLFENVFGYDKG